MVDRRFIGWESPHDVIDVEAGAIRFFAKTIGLTDPRHFELDVARQFGLRGLLAPPTFAFTLNLMRPEPRRMLQVLGIDIGRILHGSQQFDYGGPICSGDRIELDTVVKDIYERKAGALHFVVHETRATNQLKDTVVLMTNTTIVRSGAGDA